MITREELEEALSEAHRFIARATALRNTPTKYEYPSLLHASAKRAALDLRRALVPFNRNG